MYAMTVSASRLGHAVLPWVGGGADVFLGVRVARAGVVSGRWCVQVIEFAEQVLQQVPGDDGSAVVFWYPGLPETEAIDSVDHHGGIQRAEAVQPQEVLGPLRARHDLPPMRRARDDGTWHPRGRQPAIGRGPLAVISGIVTVTNGAASEQFLFWRVLSRLTADPWVRTSPCSQPRSAGAVLRGRPR